MNAFVVADAHGHLDLVAGLLRQAGILDAGWERVDRRTLVVQIGDLCNCVARDVVDDSRCLDHAAAWFDVCLVGNHEHPYFGGPPFSGFWPDPALGRRLHAMNDSGLLQPSVAVDGVLVSHAGLTPEMAGPEGTDHPGWLTADAADEEIRWAWRQQAFGPRIPLFSAVGVARRGGYRMGGLPENGGILWSDWSEPKTDSFPQLVGHTPGDAVRRRDFANGNWAVCIDVGGKRGGRLAGAWLRAGELEVVEYTARSEAAA